MVRIFLTSLILFSFYSTYAATITVKKVKGKQAIIESSVTLNPGETYELQTEDISLDPLPRAGLQDRRNSLNLGLQFTSIKGSNVQENGLDLSGTYGWNLQNFEFGPSFSYTSSDVGAGTNSTILVGGFFDWNLIKNKAPENWIYGLTSNAQLGQMQFANGSTANLMNIEFGGAIKYFLFKQSVALRGEMNYALRRVNTSNTQSDLNGFVGRGYLSFYF